MKLSINLVTLTEDDSARIENADLRLLVDHARAQQPPPGTAAIVTALFAGDDDTGPRQSRLELPATAEGTAKSLADLSGDADRTSGLFLSEGRYLGCCVAYHATSTPWKGPLADAWDTDAPVPVVMCLDTDGGIAVLARPPAAPARIVVAPTLLDSAGMTDPIADSMRTFHSGLDFLSRMVNPAAPDAPHEALPAHRAPDGTPSEETMALVTLRTRIDQSPQGRVFPPLPPGHPFASRYCYCGELLGDRECVQELAVAPDIKHPDAARRRAQGRWYDAMGLLVHHECVSRAMRRIVTLLAALVADRLDPPPPDPLDRFARRELTEAEARALPDDEVRRVILAAFTVEAVGADAGWDQMPPTAYSVLVPDPDPEPGGVQPPALLVALMTDLTGSAESIFEELVAVLEEAPDKLRALVVPGRRPIAMAAMTEAWTRLAPAADFQRRKGLSLQDMPGSIEIRFVVLVDDTVTVLVTRNRGDQPRAQVFPRHIALPDKFGVLQRCLWRLQRLTRDAYAR